jgi:phospholipid/cholesterol/gamma-HCH transport system substrate-binding protein
MYASRTTQFIVGIFAILGIVALVILSLSLGKISIFPAPGYTLYANFDNISGLKTNDQVELDGVQIGKVTYIGLDQRNMRARIAMRVSEGVEIDSGAIASCKTSGLIGDKYVAIALGPSDRMLHDGATIHQTESCFVLEDAIGQLINSSGSSNSGSGGSSSSDKESKAPNSEKDHGQGTPEKK